MKVLLAKKFNGKQDVDGWLASEKLDGMRAYWDGCALLSRNGNRIEAPLWFTDNLPHDIHLDGELFIARGYFQQTVSTCRKQVPVDAEWQEVKFKVFDALPEEKRTDAYPRPFHERYQYMLALDLPQHVQIVEHKEIVAEDVATILAEYERMGAEGIMLRDPNSFYERKRSSSLLKVKSFLDDEATIVAHRAGTGRHKGRMGSLICELADGTKFRIGTGFTDKQRENPPPVGDVVVFSYFELTNKGVPRFPAFMGVRVDKKPQRPKVSRLTKTEPSAEKWFPSLKDAPPRFPCVPYAFAAIMKTSPLATLNLFEEVLGRKIRGVNYPEWMKVLKVINKRANNPRYRHLFKSVKLVKDQTLLIRDRNKHKGTKYVNIRQLDWYLPPDKLHIVCTPGHMLLVDARDWTILDNMTGGWVSITDKRVKGRAVTFQTVNTRPRFNALRKDS